MKRQFSYIIGVMLAVVLTACEHKELCYDHAHTVPLKVVFDWRKVPEASPASMSFYLFPKGGSKALRYEFTNYRGGTLNVALGTYDALCLNSDTENIRYRNTERRETFEVTTRESELLSGFASLGVRSDNAPRAEGTEDERIALSPDWLWSACIDDIILTLKDTLKTRVVYPEEFVCSYTVEIRNIANMEYTSGMSASLSTMSGGINLYSGELTDESVTIPFELTPDKEQASACGSLRTFGHCPSVEGKHYLVVYAVLMDGNKWYYTYDVTDQIHTAPNPHRVHIVVEGLPLPKPIVNGGGFHPTIEDWQTIEVDIAM